MFRRRLAIAGVLLLVAAPASAEGMLMTHPDIGPILGIREYAVGLMEGCFDKVEARPLFMETAENWRVQNVDDLLVLDRALASAHPSESDWAAVHAFVTARVDADIAGAQNPLTLCEQAAESLVSGSFDIVDMEPDAMNRLRAANPGN